MFRISRMLGLAGALVLVIAFLTIGPLQAADRQQTRIVGGQEAEPGEWPWQVAIGIASYGPYAGLYCGGTLIAPSWVLTAAHCLDWWLPNELVVYAGIHDLADPEPGFQKVAIHSFHQHEGWLDFGNDDIALIRLAEPISERPADGDILPIAYLDQVPADPGSLAGIMSTVTGWGAIDNDGGGYPARLQEVEVPITTDAECRRVYGNVLSSFLCAGVPEGGKDSCYGDSGGPLAIYNDAEERWEQAAIVSGGYGCALPELPGIYTRVSAYTDWIAETMTFEPQFHFASLPLILTPADPPITPIPNGGFEEGHTIWEESSEFNWPTIYHQDDLPPLRPPFEGEWAAWLGGADNEVAIITQEVEIPIDEPILTFYHWIDSIDSCGYDWGYVNVGDETIDYVDLCSFESQGEWTRKTVDLTSYAGETVLLHFIATTDYVGVSNWFIDNVGFSRDLFVPEVSTAAPSLTPPTPKR